MTLVAVPHTGELRYSLVERLLEFDKKENVEVYMNKARPVDVNRCEIVNYFLEDTEHDRLVMIDSDIVPPDSLFEMLEKYDSDVLSPIVFSTEDGVPYPVATMKREDNGKLTVYQGDIEELTEVDGIGTGCIAIKREVFENMDKPYFDFRKNEDGTLNTGEDFDFCLKAKNAGFDVEVATEYTAGHISNVDLENYMRMMKMALDANPSDIFVEEVG